MKKFTFLSIIALSAVIGLAAACSSETTTTTNDKQTRMLSIKRRQITLRRTPLKRKTKLRQASKRRFPTRSSFTKQHKDIPADAIADIEKDTGGKVPDTDHHSYLAFASENGKRTQIGAATVVKADGKDIVIVYENKDGMPVIKEVRAEGVSADFLKQFAGKGHDDKLLSAATSKPAARTRKLQKRSPKPCGLTSLTMQKLYGAAHSH